MADLDIATTEARSAEVETPLLVVHIFERDEEPTGPALEALDERLDGRIARVLERGDFRGRKDETLVLYAAGAPGPERVLLVGLGKREDYTVERLREAVGTAVRQTEWLGVAGLALTFDHLDRLSERMGDYYAAKAAVEGAVLAAWDFRELKAAKEESEDAPRRTLERLTLVAGGEDVAAEFRRASQHGAAAARAENLARDLATRPANIATPAHLAEQAEGIADEHGLDFSALGPDEIEDEEMGGLLAVAQGSEQEPRFIVLEYDGGAGDEPPLVLIGKGVTFDSGGISIKRSKKMSDMKYDMAGAAAVLAALSGIAELELGVNVVGLVPATENLPSGRALKPGDVISGVSGKTIEVINTDAEGRLILSDALAYAARYEPAAIVDAATLTGSCVVALGHHAIGLMGNDGALIDEVRAAGRRVDERCWPLPLWDDYREQLDSDVADIKNTGGRPAGTITAGWFLKEFVGEVPWAHLDVAGMAWREEAPPHLRGGATGMPTRLFIDWVRARARG